MLVAALITTSGVQAASKDAGKIKTESGIELIPQLSVGYKQDDNIENASAKEQSSSVLTVDPSLAIQLQRGVNAYAVNASLKSASHSYSSTSNYVDTRVDAMAHLEASDRTRFNVKASADWVSEALGTGINERNSDLFDEPVRYNDNRLSLNYEFGAQTAIGRLSVTGMHRNKTYQNFETLTQYRNFKSNLLNSKFIYNPQTGNEVFVELSYDQIRYDYTLANEFQRDSNDIRALAGIDLKASSMTSGSFKLGYQKKDFSDIGRENFTGLSWEGKLAWAPLSYSRFSLLTSKAAIDSLTVGDFIKCTRHSVSWQHDWSGYISSGLSASYLKDDFVGVVRNDSTKNIRAEGAYQVLRWLKASLHLDVNSKQSTDLTLEHDKVVLGVTLHMTL